MSLAMWSNGMTQTDLALLFKMNRVDVKSKLGNIRPIGRRNNTEIYDPKEAARVLLPPPADMVERILGMNASDLPKMLSKEYWYGQNQRLNYMERIGDLWSTSAVIDLAGETFKTLRLSLMLLADAVERENGLTPQQRDLLSMLVNSALEDMRTRLVDGFNQRRSSSVGKSFAPVEDIGSAEGL